MQLPKLVKVNWYDIVRTEAPWSSQKDLEEIQPALVYSVGWLVKEDAKHITLATHVDPDWQEQDLGVLVCIPKCVIEVIVPLHGGEECQAS